MNGQITTAPARLQARGRLLRRAFLGGASTLVLSALAAPAALAQAAPEEPVEAIVVTGIRGSLERSMDIKRNSDGVVDAISAEDIGKFPSTNLAESLQRITGVSISRVNGEGSMVTVRGFGPGFNLVTLNGRTMPTTSVATVGGDQNSDFAIGSSRSFDFGNLASEGVQTLEVYKTGRAEIPSGGLGATINVKTFKPLDNPGFTGTVGVKAAHDQNVYLGDDVTPEASGLFSWTDEDERFGVSLFGSYQERDSTSRAATVNGWNIVPYDTAIAGDTQFVGNKTNAATKITNAPANGDQLVAFPNDSRYHLMDTTRERINGQLALQFRPIDALTLSADFTYADNQLDELRTDQTNWFNQIFNEVTFDSDPTVPTTVFIEQDIASADNPSSVKDIGFEQQHRAIESKLQSEGFNAQWDLTDTFGVSFDAHHSWSKAWPDNPMGASSTLLGTGATVIASHSLDFRSGFPVQDYVLNDNQAKGNGNNQLDIGDVASSIARTITSAQNHEVDEMRFDAGWDDDEGGSFHFGLEQRWSNMIQQRVQTQQTLGNWSGDFPGDVERFAPGALVAYCLSCLYEDFTPGRADIAFRGDAVTLYQALSPIFAADGNPVNGVPNPGNPVEITTNDYNQIKEDVFAAYFQLGGEGTLLSRPVRYNGGVRYETTEVTSIATQTIPSAILWVSDNDFTQVSSANKLPVSQTGDYEFVLPSADFAMDLTDDLVGRVSWSRTIARPSFGSLFTSLTAGNPPRPTALGGIASGRSGNAGLLPLTSDNLDVSLEWYFDEASYISIGAYEKRVNNFEGVGQTTQTLFDLRDPASGAPGTRSGQAAQIIADTKAALDEANLFTLTALIDHFGAASAQQQFQAHVLPDGTLPFEYVNEILTQYDVVANGSDPLFQFEVTQPINSRDARIYGIELAGQYFLGDTGFGISGSLTTVDGDVEFDNGAPTDVDQFALVGLSDTYNITLIYEKYGLSTRLAYNWRDKYLTATNRPDSYRNPVYTADFGSLDLNVTYDLTDNIQLSFEGLNLTAEHARTYGRTEAQLWYAQELDPRFLVGARYKF